MWQARSSYTADRLHDASACKRRDEFSEPGASPPGHRCLSKVYQPPGRCFGRRVPWHAAAEALLRRGINPRGDTSVAEHFSAPLPKPCRYLSTCETANNPPLLCRNLIRHNLDKSSILTNIHASNQALNEGNFNFFYELNSKGGCYLGITQIITKHAAGQETGPSRPETSK